MILKTLIGEIDEKLFERVVREAFESEYVQDANPASRCEVSHQRQVRLKHDEIKQAPEVQHQSSVAHDVEWLIK